MNRLTRRSIAPGGTALFLFGALVTAFAIVFFFRPGGSNEAASATRAVAPKAAVASIAPHQAGNSAPSAESDPDAAPPTATEFADEFVGVTNQHAKENGDAVRLARADCAQAAPGRYMCSYAVEKPGASTTCHVMQARWTPGLVSSFTVTLSGRTRKCGSLREAIRTLQ